MKQLSARNRYLQYKSSKNGIIINLKELIFFFLYPNLEKAYKLCRNLTPIFNNTQDKKSTLLRLAKWDNR
ncbi:hypothetical protein E9099_00535 [Psychroserpens sp. NJDZ02]|nr:hypothetical protein E9099_00535 [Psychroserpens sp. NJDZ02]